MAHLLRALPPQPITVVGNKRPTTIVPHAVELRPGSNAEYDPEGILPPASQGGGHFARREGQTTISPLLQKAGQATPGIVNRVRREESLIAPEDSIALRIETAFQEVFNGERAAPRMLKSFRRLCAGDEYRHHHEGLGIQQADSFVEGLRAVPFPEIDSLPGYAWLHDVEKHAATIQQEFKAAMADGGVGLKAKGNNIWVPAARKEAIAYGPAWRTLVIQDRGIWEEDNSKLFPKTKKIFSELNAPTVEIFFARQEAHTGIKSHTDNTNFIQTSHLGIDIPEGQCWIKVGDFTKEWRNGKIIICDTSFLHETQNDADVDRYVLIMRHWHPEMSLVERAAAQFLFDAVDDPSTQGLKAAQKKASKTLKGIVTVGKTSRKKAAASSGGGFGGGFGKK